MRVLLLLCCAGMAIAESRDCARCHADLYSRYLKTGMALSSGLARDIRVPDHAQFRDPKSNYLYTIARREGEYRVDMQPIGSAEAPVSRLLKYFVGSGAAARSYLLDVDGFLYEAPVTYYGQSGMWNFSPGYEKYSYPFLTRAIAPGCLECHASRVQPIAGTQNGFRSPPFLEGGVGCERCHGPGAKHMQTAKAADIVKPRGEVCEECHLSGDVRVDGVAFVRAGASRRMRVTSHVENLAQSACKRASGDRMWCGTCHDPHFTPAPAERAAWFRQKCLTCHADADCKAPRATRAAARNDCTACHMQRRPVVDAEHAVYTDHSIPRRASQATVAAAADAALIPFGGKTADARATGLAYAIVAIREQNAVYRERAFGLLKKANEEHPDDPQTLSYLADLYKGRSMDREAAALYERLLRVDPSQSSAPAALGAYHLEQGHYDDAIRFFQQALRTSPALVLVRANLAAALIHQGRRDEARAVLRKALEFNPYFPAAKKMLEELR